MKEIIMFILLIWGSTAVYSQQVITGRVYDNENNEMLIGASVRLMKQNHTTSTDLTGKFKINIHMSDTLLVSFTGYEAKKIPITTDKPNQILAIALQSKTAVLQSVTVSTGYQKLPKERATGSFALIDQKTFNEQVGTTVLDRLPNIANSLSVDRRTSTAGNLSIRGLSTIQGPKSPLIVLDNFPYQGDLNNLNPNDIESITILKDAAAASIWGAKAGNGVIVITTKKAKFNQPIRIGFNSNLTISKEPDLHQINRVSSSDIIDVEQFLFSKGKYNITTPATARASVTPLIALLRQKAAGVIDPSIVDAQINSWRRTDVRDEFARYFYQPGLNQQYSLSLNTGTETLAWKAMLGYDKNKNELDADFQRINLNLQTVIRPIKNLEISATILFTKSNSESGKPAYGTITMTGGDIPSYGQFADGQGTPMPWAKNYSLQFVETAGEGKLLDWNYYPLNDHEHSKSLTEMLDITADLNASYKIIKGLEFGIFYRYGRQQGNGSTLNDKDSYFSRNLINTYTQINPITAELSYKVPIGAILDLSNFSMPSHNLRGQVSFNKEWKDNSLNIIGGLEFSEDKTASNGYRTYGYDPEVLTYGQVDYTNRYPNFATGSNAYIPNSSSIIQKLNRYTSAYLNAGYTFKQRYLFSLSARKDGSNLFGVLPNNRFNPLGSLGIAWEITKEHFFKIPALDYLKFRVTYGLSGNTDQNSTAYPTIGYYGTSLYTLEPYAKIESFANPDLRWEKVAMLNVGIDFRFKNSAISGSLEYYRKDAKDLFGRAQIDYTTGVGSTIVKNIASMSAQGIDIELNSVNIQRKHFKWLSSVNINLNNDKVKSYYSTAIYGNRFVGNTSPIVSAVAGKPVYAVYSYKWLGLDPENGDPIGMVNDQPSKDYTAINGTGTKLSDLIYHGSALPTFFGNLRNTFVYSQFSITFALNYKFNYYFKRRSIDYNALYNSRNGHSDYAIRWQKPGDELHTTVPSQPYPAVANRDAFYNSSEATIIKGDHIRLQYITFNYHLTKSTSEWLPFKSINLYANANNLGMIWRANKQGIDPEYPETSVPPSKNIAIGIKADF